MFTSSILRPAGALGGSPAAQPARSVRVNASCARGPRSVSGAHSAARCVSARFASDARLSVTALRAGQAHCRARRGVSARAEGSSGAQYGEVRPTPRFKKCENAPRENQQHAVHSKERKTRQRAPPAALTRTSPRSPASYPQRFADVDRVLVSYFTFRALKETLSQIQQTDLSPNKTEYKWLYTFASENNPNDSQRFIKALFAARPDYGQRILAQRQSLFDDWGDHFMPQTVGKAIEDQNLEHLRDQLFATVNLDEACLFTGDDAECIPEEEKVQEKVEASVKNKESSVDEAEEEEPEGIA